MKESEINKNTICAIATTYHPNESFLDNMQGVLSQVGMIIVVDNTASKSNTAILEKLEDKIKNTIIIKNTQNLGSAKALNQGISHAQKLNYSWILTLDQDTRVHDGLIDLYIKALVTNFAGVNIGVINTTYRDTNTGKLGITFGNKKKDWTDVPALITSGSFFSIETYKKVGPFREEFFLDWADHDFCLRARACGLRNFIYKTPFLDHTLGSKTEHKILFTKFIIPTNNHSSFRCYLISRNLTILLKKNYIREFQWSLYLTFYLITKFILVPCFESNKLPKIKNLLKGLLDGLLNKSSTEMILKYQKSKSE